MKILVVNSGSSSIKYTLFDMGETVVMAAGMLERIGDPAGRLASRWRDADGVDRVADESLIVADHRQGLKAVIDRLAEGGVLHDPGELDGIGHRVVHGGELFSAPTPIDATVIEQIRRVSHLAPLHNPANLVGIEVALEVAPGVPQVAVFDTAFHQTLPSKAYRYAVPTEMYSTHHVRRYGFHGTSHQYVAGAAAAFLKRPLDTLRVITLHLGNGASAAAITEGRSVDTSMGMTPLAGLMMGTRCGDLDPAIPFHLATVMGRTNAEVSEMLNHQSGLKGICGVNDMREVQQLAAAGDGDAQLAIDMFCYQIRKTIGSYLAVLGGADAIVFTGGIGEHAPGIRAQACAGLDGLGICIDVEKNKAAEGMAAIHRDGGGIALLVIPTNEELGIAGQTMSCLAAERKE